MVVWFGSIQFFHALSVLDFSFCKSSLVVVTRNTVEERSGKRKEKKREEEELICLLIVHFLAHWLHLPFLPSLSTNLFLLGPSYDNLCIRKYIYIYI